MSTSRQDPGYPVDESIKDAVGVLTAFCVPDGVDDALIDRALESALQNTDHTALVYNIGLMMRIMCGLGAQARGEHPADFARAIAEAAMSAIEDNTL